MTGRDSIKRKASCITVNAVKKGICNRLDKKFGYEVYADEIEQGFAEPSFFVEIVNTSQRKIGYYRYDRKQTFCIHFFPDSNESKNERILDITEELYFLLEYINVNGDLCRGTNLRHTASGGVLHFLVDYNYHLIKLRKPEALMEKLKYSGGLKMADAKKYSKQQFLSGKAFAADKDLLAALLKDGETYTKADVAKLVKNYQSKAVK